MAQIRLDASDLGSIATTYRGVADSLTGISQALASKWRRTALNRADPRIRSFAPDQRYDQVRRSIDGVVGQIRVDTSEINRILGATQVDLASAWSPPGFVPSEAMAAFIALLAGLGPAALGVRGLNEKAMSTSVVSPASMKAGADVAFRDQLAALTRGLSPGEFHRWWASLSEEERRHLAVDLKMGNIEGVPYDIRYEVNRFAVDVEAGRVAQVLKSPWFLLGAIVSPSLYLGQKAELATYLENLEAIRDSRAYDDASMGQEHKILFFAPNDDTDRVPAHGIAEVWGELDSAHDIVVAVPGTGTDLGNFAEFSSDAGSLQSDHPSAAVVAWFDYAAPPGLLDNLSWTEEYDSVDASNLRPLLESLSAEGRATTLLGHSTGSVVVEHVFAGLPPGVVDNVVLVSPPVLSVEFLDAVAPETRVFVAMFKDDPLNHVDKGMQTVGNPYVPYEHAVDRLGVRANFNVDHFLQADSPSGDTVGIDISAHFLGSYLTGDTRVALDDFLFPSK